MAAFHSPTYGDQMVGPPPSKSGMLPATCPATPPLKGNALAQKQSTHLGAPNKDFRHWDGEMGYMGEDGVDAWGCGVGTWGGVCGKGSPHFFYSTHPAPEPFLGP